MKYLHQLKSQAKKLSKKEGLILTKAQDKIAVENGYQDWQKLTQDFTFCIGLWKPDSEFKVIKTSSKEALAFETPYLLRGLQDLIAGKENRNGLLEAVPKYYMDHIFPNFKNAKISILMDEKGNLKDLPPHSIKPFVGPLAFVGLKPWNYFEDDGNQWVGLHESQIKFIETFSRIRTVELSDGGIETFNVTYLTFLLKKWKR